MASTHQRCSIAWVNSPAATPPQRIDCQITFSPSLDNFLSPKQGTVPTYDLIVIGVQTPDEQTSDRIELLIAQHPLAEILFINSPWAEGTPRSRQTIPLAWSVPHYRADHRIELCCQNVLAGRVPIPSTATYQQGFQREFTDSHNSSHALPNVSELMISVHSRDPAFTAFLCDWLHTLNIESPSERQRSPDLLLVDIDPVSASHWKQVMSMNSMLEGVIPWIALTGEPACRDFASSHYFLSAASLPPVCIWHKQQSLTVWEQSLSKLHDQGMITAQV